ncbi:MAG: hypothetical protein KC421_02765 [Anaerolineales bacterium]|nr:hypothetical protein [Anaerolineales bacterium]
MSNKVHILFIFVLLISTSACRQDNTANDSDYPFIVEGELPASPPAIELITDAANDLAERENVRINEVTFVALELPVWSDTSYGCPDPETAYLFTPKEGYKIQLRVNGRDFFYHGGEDIEQFLCENN